MKIIQDLSVILILFVSCSCAAQPESAQKSQSYQAVNITTEVEVEQLKSLFQSEAYYQRFSGVVQVCHQDQLIFQQALGGQSRGISSGINTRFDIGSISKSFTAAAILSLAHDGRLNLQDAANTHLGDLQSKHWKKVTIHHLLTHTSGIPSIYQTEQGLSLFLPEKERITLPDLIAKFSDGKMLFKPGSQFSYSNSGYVLLAAIIEQVSGKSFEQFMDKEIFKKYGLINTAFKENDLTAQPYFGYRKDLTRKASSSHWSWAIGAGGIQTNLVDLAKWLKIIQSDTFLNQELRKAYMKQHESAGYGYGWQFTNGRIQHDGGTAGYISFVSFDPNTRSHVIILSNRSFEDINRFGESSNYISNLVNKTWRVLDGKAIESLPAPGKNTIESYHYQFGNDRQIAIKKASDSTFWVEGSNLTPSRIIPTTALDGTTDKERMMNDAANLLLHKKHWGLAKYCNGEMKFVCYSGLFGIGMKMIRNKTGKLKHVTAYFVQDQFGLFRVIGERQAADLIAYFDGEGRIKGLFEKKYYPLDQITPMLAYPTKNGGLLLDGFNIGEPDVMVEFQNDQLLFSQSGRTILGTKVQ